MDGGNKLEINFAVRIEKEEKMDGKIREFKGGKHVRVPL